MCLPRLVSVMPSAADAWDRVVEEQLVEIAHAVEQEAVRMTGLDLHELRHHGRRAALSGGV